MVKETLGLDRRNDNASATSRPNKALSGALGCVLAETEIGVGGFGRDVVRFFALRDEGMKMGRFLRRKEEEVFLLDGGDSLEVLLKHRAQSEEAIGGLVAVETTHR